MSSWGSYNVYPPIMGQVGPGLEYETSLVETRGREAANANLTYGLRRVEIGGATVHISYLAQWGAFQRSTKGRWKRFLFRLNSPLFEMTDQRIGVGDGEEAVFQLKKTSSYPYGPAGEETEIVRYPVHDYPPIYVPNTQRTWLDTGYVQIYINGVLKTLTTDYTVQREGGLITFTTPPAADAIITATCKYFILARQSADFNPVQATSAGMQAFTVPSDISIIEVRGAP